MTLSTTRGREAAIDGVFAELGREQPGSTQLELRFAKLGVEAAAKIARQVQFLSNNALRELAWHIGMKVQSAERAHGVEMPSLEG